jgi:hypothetical protein
MATFFCDVCNLEANFLSLHHAMLKASVCRSTLYYWMQHGWVHWRELPSGRRLICINSLSCNGGQARPATQTHRVPLNEVNCH